MPGRKTVKVKAHTRSKPTIEDGVHMKKCNRGGRFLYQIDGRSVKRGEMVEVIGESKVKSFERRAKKSGRAGARFMHGWPAKPRPFEVRWV